MNYTILTNNPMVEKEFGTSHRVIYYNASAMDVLGKAAERIVEGEALLNHPLYGSVKPNETPYRTILLKSRGDSSFAGVSSEESADLIIKALKAYEKFSVKKETTDSLLLQDYQIVDLSLATSAVSAADR